jgi:phosphate transport system permease protein
MATSTTPTNAWSGPGIRIALRRLRKPVGNRGDIVFQRLLLAAALALILVLGAIAVELCVHSWPSIRAFGLRFLGSTAWDPVKERFGGLPFIYGTLVSSLLALLIAVPISLGVAIFLVELAPGWLRGPVGFLVELLAALPSVVYGLWGVFVLVPWLRQGVEPALGRTLGFLPVFAGPNQGFGMLAGGLVLSIMILPTISSVSREVLRAVPNWLRESALALGTTRWEMIRGTVLPFARSGIIGAVILGLGRALGETMAVTMVIGNRPHIATSLFAPGYTMASVIANEYTEATSDLHLAALTEIGLLLFGVTLVLNALARILVWRVERTTPRGGR